jgi:hypothetical protein
MAADLGYDFDSGQRITNTKPEPSAADKLRDGLTEATRDPRYLQGGHRDTPQLRRALRAGFEGLAREQGADGDPVDDLAPEQAVQLMRQRDGVEPSQWMTPELEQCWSPELEGEYHELIDLSGMRSDVAQQMLDRYVELRGRLGASLDDTISEIKNDLGPMLEPAVLRALEQWARESGL